MRVNDYIKRQGQATINVLALDDQTQKRLQDTVEEIATDIIECCESHSIDYTLGGGSVLGAVRHGGFIPWDDDIDINMPRSSWNRFVRTFRDRRYQLQSPDLGAVPINAIKVLKKGTVLQELATPPHRTSGIFVDIFLIENVPDNVLLRLIHGLGADCLRYLSSCTRLYHDRRHLQMVFGKNPRALSAYRFRWFVGSISRIIPLRTWVQLSNRWNGLCHNEHSRYITIPTGARRYFGEMRERQSYFPPVAGDFGSHKWLIPRNYKDYLTKLYGNWVAIPPHEKREQHILLDLNFGN